MPTYFLNFDCLGIGPPRFFGAEIPLFGLPAAYPRAVIDVARETANQLGLENAGPHTMPGPTDGLSFLKHGVPGMSIVSFRHHGYMPTYHRLQDTPENLEFDAAWRGILFGRELLDRLVDHEAQKMNRVLERLGPRVDIVEPAAINGA